MNREGEGQRLQLSMATLLAVSRRGVKDPARALLKLYTRVVPRAVARVYMKAKGKGGSSWAVKLKVDHYYYPR